MKTHLVVGLMSGTSLDGLDIALISFNEDRGWKYNVVKSQAIGYDESMQHSLSNAITLSGLDLKILDLQYGEWLGTQVKSFLENCNTRPELVVSHGHTIFHQPDIGLTLQIGDGYRIMKETGIRTICDLRSLDVAYGGQGAPLVPIGDKLLFPQYEYCLNLGGFSNISSDIDGERIAYDICPVNTVLNYLASKLGFNYDKNGAIAGTGKPIFTLLDSLNELPFYKQHPPKSLGIEWVNSEIIPLLTGYEVADMLHTYCLHIASQIAQSISSDTVSKKGIPKILVTGGGARNAFLIETIKKELEGNAEVIIPDDQTIDFKEAIIFGFLGLLRLLGRINTLKTVTGATTDSTGGLIFDNPVELK